MKKVFKKMTALVAATIVISSVSAIGAGAVTLDKTFNMENSYLTSTQTYGYDSSTNTTFATNLTKCKKDNYTAILSCAELKDKKGNIYSNATDFRPYADKGSFLKVKTSKDFYFGDKYARYWSYVDDENDVVRGEFDITRRIIF
ncbi:hypothetical protein [Ruminococcus sp.]|uniref:hypothetical protein n=1 Tax=Ruminococcus sp. TaxID=41978 RepID=UPI0025CBB8E8|nr:hypothetical protein [Ruminococcus sp.]